MVKKAPAKLVFCMKWGTRYGAEYVNRLYRSVKTHTTGPVQVVCFTDDTKGIVKAVDCRPLPAFKNVRADLANKPWRKLSLWQKGLGKDLAGRDALFLDLDLVIAGSLDDFWAYCPGKYAVWENPSKPGTDVGNTSVFRFKVGSEPEIYERFMKNPVRLYEKEFRIEQEFISARLGTGAAARVGRNPAVAADAFYKGKNLQVFWPKGWVVSFKEDLLPAWPMRLWRNVPLPAGARVVAFHGKPDPDEAARGHWPEKKWWKRFYKRLRPVHWISLNWR
ncbi:MAG TPA: hypothetical protein VHP58_07270 [Alphaproteobacteria bacterium]|nr:hypothetical protein [Alphaproteobacteria bacterium]